MSSGSVPASRPRLAVAWVLSLLAAPVLVCGLARVSSSWTGEPHDAAWVTLAALVPALVAGVVALVRGATHPWPAWLAAAGAAVLLLATTASPVTAVVAAALAGVVAARGLPWVAASAPVPRGRGAAVLWGLVAVLAVVQVGRMSIFMADAHARWGALAPAVDVVARHSCLTSYVHGAELARRGDANIYDDRYGFEGDEPPELPTAIDVGPLTMDTYEYPPQFLPLPRLMLAISPDFAAIRALWFTLTVAVFVLVTLVLARWLGGDPGRRMRLLAPAVGLSLPVLTAVYFGNFQITAMGLSVLAMYAIFTGRTRSGAALLAFVIGAKIFPGILGVYLLAARRFAAAAWTAAFGALYAALALVLFGTRPFVDFFGYHLPRLASGETFSFLREPVAAMSNLGVFGVPFRLRIAGWGGSEADAWALAQQLSWVYTLVVVVVAVLAGWRRREPSTAHERLAMITGWFGLVALGALRSPFAPLEAMIPVIWALAFRAAGAARRRDAVVAGALWVVLMINVPMPTPISAVIALVLQALAWATAGWLALGGRER